MPVMFAGFDGQQVAHCVSFNGSFFPEPAGLFCSSGAQSLSAVFPSRIAGISAVMVELLGAALVKGGRDNQEPTSCPTASRGHCFTCLFIQFEEVTSGDHKALIYWILKDSKGLVIATLSLVAALFTS